MEKRFMSEKFKNRNKWTLLDMIRSRPRSDEDAIEPELWEKIVEEDKRIKSKLKK